MFTGVRGPPRSNSRNPTMIDFGRNLSLERAAVRDTPKGRLLLVLKQLAPGAKEVAGIAVVRGAKRDACYDAGTQPSDKKSSTHTPFAVRTCTHSDPATGGNYSRPLAVGRSPRQAIRTGEGCPMAIELRCPDCGNSRRCPIDSAGKQRRCKCGAVFRVPAEDPLLATHRPRLQRHPLATLCGQGADIAL